TVPSEEKDGQVTTVSHQADYELLAKISHYYQQSLRQSTTAIDYLKARGVTGAIAKQFNIGYAPTGWENLKSLHTDEKTLLTLIENGLIIKKNDRCFDRFRHRIMFPIRDVRGR